MAIPQNSRLRDPWFVAIEGTLVTFILVVIFGSIFWLLPAAKRSDHRAAIQRKQEATYLLKTVRAAGFKNFDGQLEQMLADNNLLVDGFIYHVGSSCYLPVYVDGGDKPYLFLKGTEGTINITYAKLKTLPQTKPCFG